MMLTTLGHPSAAVQQLNRLPARMLVRIALVVVEQYRYPVGYFDVSS
jgi:hypothetical protein